MNTTAELIIHSKEIVSDLLVEVVVWRVPSPVPGSTHLFKYRFYAGTMKGICLVRYDNERGKGDHRHVRNKEEAYHFTSLVQLKEDFMADVFAMIKEDWP